MRINLIILFLLLPSALAAAPIIYPNVTVDDLSWSTARISWWTDQPSDLNLHYGKTNAYGQSTDGRTSANNLITHSAYLSTLEPATTYHICPQSKNQASEQSICDGVQNDYTFTTLPKPPESARVAQLPTQETDISMPTMTGITRTINPANNCNNPGDGLQATLDAANRGDTIIIPTGTVCTGHYYLPAKPGTGWIVLRTSTPDNQLPQGVRVTPADKPKLATLRTNRLEAKIGGYPNHATQTCTSWPGGVFWYDRWQNIDSTGMRLWQCNGVGAVELVRVPYTQGTTVPSTCTENSWFWKSDAPEHEGIYWCINGTYEWMDMVIYRDNPARRSLGALTPEAGASHYRIIGLELTHVPFPNGFDKSVPGTSEEIVISEDNGGRYSRLVSWSTGAHHIIFDRLYMHTYKPPTGRLGSNIVGMNPDHNAIINSYMTAINYKGTKEGDSASYNMILGGGTTGPLLIQNNYMEASGINIFADASNTMIYDVTIRGNHIIRPHWTYYPHPDTLGYYIAGRHLIEFKRGARVLIENNVIEGRPIPNTHLSAAIAISSTGPYSHNPFNKHETSDYTIRNNILKNMNPMFQLSGYVYPDGNTMRTKRITIENNLVYNILGYTYFMVPSWLSYGGGGMVFWQAADGMEDLIIRHNTVAHINGDNPTFLFFHRQSSGLIMRDNIFHHMPNGNLLSQYGGPKDLTALNIGWVSGGAPSWDVEKNAIYGMPSKEGVNPPGNIWLANEDTVMFNNPDGADFSLKSGSPLKNAASDGKDVGVDWTLLQAAVAGAEYGSPPGWEPIWGAPPYIGRHTPTGSLPAGTTTAKVTFMTDQAATCKYSTSPGVPFASMTGSMPQLQSGRHKHYGLDVPVTAGLNTFYVKCRGIMGGGVNGEPNPNDYIIQFTIGTSLGPGRLNGQPTGSLPVGTTSATLSLNTNQSATCRYSTAPGTAYASMTNTFSTTGGTSHNTQINGLSAGTHSYYTRCLASGTANNNDYPIQFTIPPPAPPANASLVAHWPLDDSAGSTAVDVIGGKTLTIQGPTWTTGKTGTGLQFDGVNDEAHPQADTVMSTTNQPLTYAAWIKTTDNDGPIIERGGGSYGAQLAINNGKASFSYRWGQTTSITTLTSTNNVNDNQWHHLTGTIDTNGAMTLYIDGNQAGTGTGTLMTSTPNDGLSIGGNNDQGGSNSPVNTIGNYAGTIDDIRIYSKALVANDIAVLVGVPASSSTPVAHWRFEETGNTVTDNIAGITGTSNAIPTKGWHGQGLGFQTAQGNVIFTNDARLHLLNKGDYTISIWTRPEIQNQNGQNIIVAHLDGTGVGRVQLAIDSDGSVCGTINEIWHYLGGDYHCTGYTITNNRWTLLTLTIKENGASDEIRLYANSNLVNTATKNIENNDAAWKIGEHKNTGSPARFQGTLDELRLYNTALTQQEITQQYNRDSRRAGDANKDGKRDILDILFIINQIKNKQTFDDAADPNEDGKANIIDLIYVVKRMG